MTSTAVPKDVARFLRAHIRSVMQLEMLLLLRGDRSRSWSIAALDKELRSSVEAATRDLAELSNSGLVRPDADDPTRYRYREDPDHEATLTILTELAKTHFHVVIHAIYASRRRIEEFADAFKLKKNGPNDDA